MAQAEAIPTTSRRRFLSILGLAGVSATATVAAVLPAKNEDESRANFVHPAEYLAAMQAIGWRPVAMFQRFEDDYIRPMGVKETAPDRAHIEKTWLKFHAISMRSPVQLPSDLPATGWWEQVWQYLYDNGLREDVTSKRAIEDI